MDLRTTRTGIFAKLLMSFITATFAPSALAGPVLFVPKGDGVWWLKDMTVRAMSAQLGGKTIAQINVWRSADQPYAPAYCFVDALSRDSIISPDRATQLEINQTLNAEKANPFLLDFEPVAAQRFRAQIGAYEECDGETGAFLMVTEIATGKIMMFEAFDDPFRHIFPLDEGVIGISSCFECGDVNSLRFDAGRRKFYWEYIGD